MVKWDEFLDNRRKLHDAQDALEAVPDDGSDEYYKAEDQVNAVLNELPRWQRGPLGLL